MVQCGFPEEDIEQAKLILSKACLGKEHPPSQVLEDVVCLVFLENYLEDFSEKHPRDKLVSIIQKTWKKMSARAQEEALGIDFGPRVKGVVLASVTAQVSNPG